MRNLKKMLCLLLAVAMIASMLVVGAYAADETSNYPEAAAVVTAIKVMEGDEGGMRYGDTITREEAATIICRILLGTELASKLTTAEAPFEDVAASHWSAGYIAYLKSKGIVSGKTETTFDPKANVTGIEFAKMLLCAVGYGANKEYEGSYWDINVLADALEKGVYDDTEAAELAAAATREECMLYTFNTITGVNTVQYNTNANTSTSTTANYTSSRTTLGAAKFGLAQAATGKDELGRESAVWTVNGAAVTGTVATVKATKTLTNAVSAAALYAALGKNVVDNMAASSTMYVDGALTVIPVLTANDYVTSIAAAGATTEIYVEYLNNGTYKVNIVVINETLGTVSAVVAATKSITINGITTTEFDTTGITTGTKLLYTVGQDASGNAKILSLTIPAKVTGIYSASNNTYRTVVVDGTTYPTRCGIPAIGAVASSYDIMIDSLGNVVDMAPTAAAAAAVNKNYVYVVAADANIVTGSLINTASQTVKVQVIYPEGGTAVLDYTILADATGKYIMVDGVKNYLTTRAAAIAAIDLGWHAATIDANGAITISEIDANYATVATITTAANTAVISGTGKVATTATTLTTLNNITAAATTVTGYAKFTAATYANALITYEKGANTITGIIVPGVAPAASAPVTYLVKAQGNNVAGGTTYTVAAMDGTTQDIVINDTLTVGALYSLTQTAGIYAATPVTTGVVNAGTYGNAFVGYAAAATIKSAEINNFTAKDNAVYYFDANTKVVDVTGAGRLAPAAGAIFVAQTAANATFDGHTYVSVLWLVG